MVKRGSTVLPLVSIVALISIIAAGFLFIQNKPVNLLTPTSNRLTNSKVAVVTSAVTPQATPGVTAYTSKLFDFSFIYPADRRVLEFGGGGVASVPLGSLRIVTVEQERCFNNGFLPGCSAVGTGDNLFQIEVYKNILTPDLENWIISSNKSINNDKTVKNIQPVTSSNLGKGFSYEISFLHGGDSYYQAFYNPNLNYVLLFSKNSPLENDAAAQKIISSTKFLNIQKAIKKPISVSAFDACGNIAQYSTEKWYPPFNQIFNENDLSVEGIADSCLALDRSRLLILMKGHYCGGPEIYQYEISTKTLEQATVNDHARGCLAATGEFGKREGAKIPLVGGGGDAGCEAEMYYDYSIESNVLELKKERGRCQNDPWQWTYY